MNSANRLREIFRALQDRIAAGLAGTRAIIDHAGAKGSAAEVNWREILSAHLPHRYKVNSAFVMDADGALSDQIDMVIYDRQYTPVLFNRDDQLFVPAESVYAVLESKQELDRSIMKYAGVKAASVRKLRRTSATVVHAGGAFEPPQPKPILAGVLALRSSWSPPFGDAFNNVLAELRGDEFLNLGCAIQSGAFEVNPDTNSAVVSEEENAFGSFFLTLLRKLQELGTVTPIDYAEYAKCLR